MESVVTIHNNQARHTKPMLNDDSAGRRIGRGLAAGLLVMLTLLLAGCGANRPEGTAERFLETVARGVDFPLINQLGSLQTAATVVGVPLHRTEKNQHYISDIEVAPAKISGNEAEMPIRFLRKDGKTEIEMLLHAQLINNKWHITGISPPTQNVRFASEGGANFGQPAGQAFLLAGLVIVVSLGLSIVLIRWIGGPRPADI